MRSELRSDLRDGYCCVCENELPTEGARVVKSARVLGLGKVSLPNCFSVCKERCAKFLGSTDKLKRPPQRLLLRRMSVALFGTCVLVDDRVRIIRDMSANRKVQAGEGTVHNIVESSSSSSISVLDSERGSLLLQSPGRLRAEILVKMAVGGGVVRVWPSGLSRISDDDADDDARRPHPVKAVPNNVLAERCQNQLARIEELKASRDAQKQRAVGADAARNLDGKRFHDGKDYVIERIATSREYDSIVAECRPVGSDGNAKLKSRSVYYGVESEDDFNEMMEMIRVYDERAAIAAIKSAKVAELKAKRAAVDEAPRPKRATRRR